jgi:hypothetical protein
VTGGTELTPANAAAATPIVPPTPTWSFFDRCKAFFIAGFLILVAVVVGFGFGRIGRKRTGARIGLCCMGMLTCAR